MNEWLDAAACKGHATDLWFAERGDNERETKAAKAICAGCPVKDQCLEAALTDNERFGIWGGYTERERRRIKRKRRTDARAAEARRIPRSDQPLKREPAACGTLAGYKRHRAANTPPCDACRKANADYARANRPSRSRQPRRGQVAA